MKVTMVGNNSNIIARNNNNHTTTAMGSSLSRAHCFKIILMALVLECLLSLAGEVQFSISVTPPVIRYYQPLSAEHDIETTKSKSSTTIISISTGDDDGGGSENTNKSSNKKNVAGNIGKSDDVGDVVVNDGQDDPIQYVQSFRKNFMVLVSPLDSSSDYTSYSYIATGRTGRGRLTFLHVPKTGGTSVEEVAARQNVSWGMCAFPRRKAKLGVFDQYCPQYPPPLPDPKQPSYGYGYPGDVWHLSRAYFPLAMMDPYHNSEVFMVVRDVYKRMVSEFYHKCRHVKRKKRQNVCDLNRLQNDMVPYVNEVLQNRLTKFLQPKMQLNPKKEKHIRKQYYFAVGPHDVRMADYVLHLEESDTEFPQLMKAYDLDKIQFNIVSDIAGTKKVVKNTTTTTTTNNNNTTTPAALFGPEHLDPQTLKIMNDYYNDDFLSFNYSMIVPETV